MWFKISQVILRNRIAIITIIGLLTVMFGYFAVTGLVTDNRYGNTLPKNSPAQEEYLKFKDMFGENEGVLILAIKTDKLYTEENFLHWRKIGDSINQLDGIKSVFSEADIFTIVNNKKKKKFEIEPIFTDLTYETKSIDEIHKEVRKIPLYDGLLYNDSSKVSLMLINIDEDYLSNMDKSDVVFQAEEIAKGYESSLGKMHFAGLPHIRVVMGKRVVNEMYIFIGLALFVTSLLLYFFFRSFRVVLYCNIVVFTAVIWSLGSIALMGFEISILMALIPPLMIVIGIPDCIYLLMKFHREVKDHGNKILALSRVIDRVGNATFLTNLTTAMGFSTFIFVNSEKLQEFGIASSLNIIGVFILSVCLIPIFYSFSKPPKKRHLKHLDKKFAKGITNKLIHATTTHRRAIYIVTALVITGAIIGATQIKATGNLTSDLPDNDPILKDILFLQDNFNGVIPFEILINYKKDARKFDKTVLQKLELIQNEMEKDTVFSKPLSIVNFMKLINMSYYGNNPAMYKLIEKRDMLRLKDYVSSFQHDIKISNHIHRFQDSLKTGQSNYADSILFTSPELAQIVMDYTPSVEDDTTETSPYPTSGEISDFLSTHNVDEQIMATSTKLYPALATGLSLKEVIDTANTTFRIRTQVEDLGSYEMGEEIKKISTMMDTVLNPNYDQAMEFYTGFIDGETSNIDSIFELSNAYRNNVTYILAEGDDDRIFEFDLNPELLSSYYDKPEFKEALKTSIEDEKLDYFITGVSVVAAEGTKYLVSNLISSIIFAIISISLLMALLFGSWKMVLVSMVPNFIPLIITAGLMGIFGIPIKPSTLLVFSIAFGISVDDTIHFLSRYRHRLKTHSHDIKGCIVNAVYETGMSMFYTSIILLCGFSMFAFSQFGGTQALGLLISLTLLVAMLTNLLVVPALLFSLEKRVATKAFMKEPFIRIYDEDVDINLSELKIDPSTRIDFIPEEDEEE